MELVCVEVCEGEFGKELWFGVAHSSTTLFLCTASCLAREKRDIISDKVRQNI